MPTHLLFQLCIWACLPVTSYLTYLGKYTHSFPMNLT